MTQKNKPLYDEHGTIRKGFKILPDEKFRVKFLEALAELEDNECHKKHNFPKTELHRLRGYKDIVYRGYIDKISGWRFHVQYGENNTLFLNDVLEPKVHDDALKVVKRKKYRYNKS